MQSKLLAALEAYKAQVALVESCIRAGRQTWALDTLKELPRYEGELNALLRSICYPGSLVSASALVLAAPTTLVSSSEPAKSAAAGRVYTPPTPRQVMTALKKMFGHLPECTDQGDIVVVSFNGHLLDLAKAERLVEPLKWFISRGHIILFQETNRDALKFLSNETGYGLNVSHRNERGQAVGILFHPRIKWLNDPIYHDYLTDIPGHPEWKTTLRPAVQRRVRDLTSGLEFDVLDMHTKSNLGGPDETAPIRELQFSMLMTNLAEQDKDGGLGRIIIGGDMNAPIDNPATTETLPLVKGGFILVPNPDHRSTYFFKGEAKGQFDGFYTRGFKEGELGQLWIPEPLDAKAEKWYYREFTDHLPAFFTIRV